MSTSQQGTVPVQHTKQQQQGQQSTQPVGGEMQMQTQQQPTLQRGGFGGDVLGFPNQFPNQNLVSDLMNWDPFQGFGSTLAPFTPFGTPFMGSTALSPFSSINNMLAPLASGEMTRALSNLQPLRIDMRETPSSLIVTADVPGIPRDNVKVELDDRTNTLHISTSKRDEKEERDQFYHRMERSSSSSYRSLRLPSNIDPASVNAYVADGVLNVNIKKREGVNERGRRRIDIGSGTGSNVGTGTGSATATGGGSSMNM